MSSDGPTCDAAEGIAELEDMPTLTLVDEQGNIRETMTKHLRNYYVSPVQEYFHLHPELIVRKGYDDAYFCLCQTCASAMKKNPRQTSESKHSSGQRLWLVLSYYDRGAESLGRDAFGRSANI